MCVRLYKCGFYKIFRYFPNLAINLSKLIYVVIYLFFLTIYKSPNNSDACRFSKAVK